MSQPRVDETVFSQITDSAASRRTGVLASINLSAGGIPKLAAPEGLITARGLAGDRQRDCIFHGGRDRAIVIYCLEIIEALQREGHPIRAGSAGENLTVTGLDWNLVAPGVLVTVGEVTLLVTKYCTPCYKIRGSFLAGDDSRISQKLHPGWSRVAARVLTGGTVRTGDRIEVIAPVAPSPQVAG
ncbi:MAG: MOSC domain-containing protein [Terriglobia bacterium]